MIGSAALPSWPWRLRRLLAAGLAGLALATAGRAADEARVERLEPRPGVRLPIFVVPAENAAATLVLVSGGKGGYGRIENGRPSSENFLVRSHDRFSAAGFHVVVLGRSSDSADWDGIVRTSSEHLLDLEAVVDHARRRFGVPVWMVGTSMGTISTAAAAIAFGNDKLAGIVLTSSVLSYRRPGAVPKQALDRIRIPVLVYHHARDACAVCLPHEARNIVSGLTAAPVKKLVLAEGGADPVGDPCDALHWHGYIGMEAQAVAEIAAWIRAPRP